MLDGKKIIIFGLIGIFFILLFILFVVSIFNKPPGGNDMITPTPHKGQDIGPKFVPRSVSVVPTIPENQGGGLDTDSKAVQESQQEIQKISPFLPYTKDYTLSTGQDISIVIPGQDLQSAPWALTVQIFGINYNTSPDQSDYTLMKDSFIEAANDIFSWISQQGANPKKIIFNWGDRKYIQDQSTNWLNKKP